MAKLIYSVTMSLDGFIAGPGGDMSWLTRHLGPNDVAEELMNRTGSLLVGRRTHDGDDPHAGDPEHEGAFGGQWHGSIFVVTHRPPATPSPGQTFVDDLPRAIELARAAAGQKYVNVLGADIARQCLELGALDEILTFIVPALLGDGTRLFEVLGGREIALEHTRVHESRGSTDLWYRVVPRVQED